MGPAVQTSHLDKFQRACDPDFRGAGSLLGPHACIHHSSTRAAGSGSYRTCPGHTRIRTDPNQRAECRAVDHRGWHNGPFNLSVFAASEITMGARRMV